MELVAVIAGAAVTFTYLKITMGVQWVLIALRYIPRLSKASWLRLYDKAANDEDMYERLKIIRSGAVRSFKDYAKLHKDARESSYDRFRHYYNAPVKLVLLRIIPIMLLPAILFWSNWYFYITGSVFVALALVLYEIIVKTDTIGARRRVLVLSTMLDYLKDKDEARK